LFRALVDMPDDIASKYPQTIITINGEKAKAAIAKPIKIKRTNNLPPPSNPAHGKRECRCQDKVK
jgi:hypothetical protein